MMSDGQNEWRSLLAERAIERLIISYAAYNDAGDWNAVAALYLPDGRMSRPTAPDVFITGRESILAAFRARPLRTTRHVVANIRVTVTGDVATATSQILLFTAPGTPPLVGSYHDRLALSVAGWRFVERAGSLDFPPA
jgi:ketosteroid isomerase-like protein